MDVTLQCTNCRKHFNNNVNTTEVSGPLIIIKCPYCNYSLSKNMSKFLWDQLSAYKSLRPGEKSRAMIRLARQIGKDVNDEVFYERKKK